MYLRGRYRVEMPSNSGYQNDRTAWTHSDVNKKPHPRPLFKLSTMIPPSAAFPTKAKSINLCNYATSRNSVAIGNCGQIHPMSTKYFRNFEEFRPTSVDMPHVMAIFPRRDYFQITIYKKHLINMGSSK